MAGPFEQECEYGTRETFDGVECVYMADPYTFPKGYGNAWVSIEQLVKDGIPIPPDRAAAVRDEWLTVLAEKFCATPLPDTVCADLVAIKPMPGRTGTNLLTVAEAKEILGKLI